MEQLRGKMMNQQVKEYCTKIANDHWVYIEGILKAHERCDNEIKIAKYHYVSSFEHGFKHALEYMNK